VPVVTPRSPEPTTTFGLDATAQERHIAKKAQHFWPPPEFVGGAPVPPNILLDRFYCPWFLSILELIGLKLPLAGGSRSVPGRSRIMFAKRNWSMVAVAIAVSACCAAVQAQSSYGLSPLTRPNSLARNSYAAGMNSGPGAASFGVGSNSLRAKPFSSLQPQNPVSPYLNLFRTDTNGAPNAFNYSTLVQPQLQQQALNDQLQRQTLQNARQLQRIAAQPNLNPQGSKDEYPTGHQTVFQYKSHYYAQPQRHAKKQAPAQQ
jgi:hypothetical protein